jgi:hypothetical protein
LAKTALICGPVDQVKGIVHEANFALSQDRRGEGQRDQKEKERFHSVGSRVGYWQRKTSS